MPTIACVEWIRPYVCRQLGSGNSRELPEARIFGSAEIIHLGIIDNLLRDPEKIIMMPCGFSDPKTQKEMEALKVKSRWANLKAFQE